MRRSQQTAQWRHQHHECKHVDHHSRPEDGTKRRLARLVMQDPLCNKGPGPPSGQCQPMQRFFGCSPGTAPGSRLVDRIDEKSQGTDHQVIGSHDRGGRHKRLTTPYSAINSGIAKPAAVPQCAGESRRCRARGRDAERAWTFFARFFPCGPISTSKESRWLT